MAIASFRSWASTVTRFLPTTSLASSGLKVLVDALSGAPVGIQSQDANGPDGIWVPIDITQAQALNPTPGMIADLNSTFRLNVAPYTRYRSDGSQLISDASEGGDFIVPAGINMLLYAPLTIATPQTMIVQGSVTVITKPA